MTPEEAQKKAKEIGRCLCSSPANPIECPCKEYRENGVCRCSSGVALRPATIADASNLFKWKNDETMRKYSIQTTKKITMAQHLLWLRKHLKETQIIMYNNIPVGDIRISGNEVAIKIDKNYRGMGIAKGALSKILVDGLIVKIVDGNIASMRTFVKLGFIPIFHKTKKNKDGDLINYYILKYENK